LQWPAFVVVHPRSNEGLLHLPGRYNPDGSYKDPALVGGLRGVTVGALPRYLLIYARLMLFPGASSMSLT